MNPAANAASNATTNGRPAPPRGALGGRGHGRAALGERVADGRARCCRVQVRVGRRVLRLAAGGRGGGRRVERQPADARVIDLDPRVRVVVAHDVLAGLAVGRAGREAGGHARGDARHPQQQRHRARVLLAVALLGVEQEAVERVRRGRRLLGVAELRLRRGSRARAGRSRRACARPRAAAARARRCAAGRRWAITCVRRTGRSSAGCRCPVRLVAEERELDGAPRRAREPRERHVERRVGLELLVVVGARAAALVLRRVRRVDPGRVRVAAAQRPRCEEDPVERLDGQQPRDVDLERVARGDELVGAQVADRDVQLLRPRLDRLRGRPPGTRASRRRPASAPSASRRRCRGSRPSSRPAAWRGCAAARVRRAASSGRCSSRPSHTWSTSRRTSRAPRSRSPTTAGRG